EKASLPRWLSHLLGLNYAQRTEGGNEPGCQCTDLPFDRAQGGYRFPVHENVQMLRLQNPEANALEQVAEFGQCVLSPMRGVFHAIAIVHLQEIVIDRRAHACSEEQAQAHVKLRLVGYGEVHQSSLSRYPQQLLQERNRVEIEVFHRLPANHPVESIGFKGQSSCGRSRFAKNLEQVAEF